MAVSSLGFNLVFFIRTRPVRAALDSWHPPWLFLDPALERDT